MLEALHSTKSVRLWASLAAKLNSFAKESGLVQRISKQFSPQAFLLSQLEAVSTGRAFLNQLVASIGHEEECLKISPQALQQRNSDKIQYEIQEGSVVIRPHPGVMAVFGALKPSAGKVSVPFKEARRKSRESWVAEAARECCHEALGA